MDNGPEPDQAGIADAGDAFDRSGRTSKSRRILLTLEVVTRLRSSCCQSGQGRAWRAGDGHESMPAAQGIEAGIDRTPASATGRARISRLVHSWIVTVDHKRLGILYICYALVFLLVAGVEALLIRVQLFFPHNNFVSPFTFNRLFTMHGTTMVFLVGMPILFGFGNYLVPLMIGARDMAFPRLNAFSFWISAFAGCCCITALLAEWGWRDGFSARCGMVRLCATDGARVFTGTHGGLLGSVVCWRAALEASARRSIFLRRCSACDARG